MEQGWSGWWVLTGRSLREPCAVLAMFCILFRVMVRWVHTYEKLISCIFNSCVIYYMEVKPEVSKSHNFKELSL